MRYIIYLGYNGNYFGRDYTIGGNKYLHETSKTNAQRYETIKEAEKAIKYTIGKCVNVDRKCMITIEEVEE